MAIKRASHCVYDTRDHLVWAPTYRKWVLQGAIRQRVKALFHEIAEHHGFAMEELEVDKDHVPLFVSFPPKYSIGQVVGLFKAVRAKEIREEFPEVRKQLWGGEFWEDGYYVRTVGDKVTADVIKKYIGFHEARKTGADQLDLF
jgi:putative transposase